MSHRVLRDKVAKETSTLENIEGFAAVVWQQVERRFFRDKEHTGGNSYKKTKSTSVALMSEGD